MLKSIFNYFSPKVEEEVVEVVEAVEVVEEGKEEEEEEVVANPKPEIVTQSMIAKALEPFKIYMSNILRRTRLANDPRGHEAGDRVMGAAYKLFEWLADPGLSLGRALMFGNLHYYRILSYNINPYYSMLSFFMERKFCVSCSILEPFTSRGLHREGTDNLARIHSRDSAELPGPDQKVDPVATKTGAMGP